MNGITKITNKIIFNSSVGAKKRETKNEVLTVAILNNNCIPKVTISRPVTKIIIPKNMVNMFWYSVLFKIYMIHTIIGNATA